MCVTLSNKEMRLKGFVRRDIMMDLEEPHAYCMFISIRLLSLEMMSANAHSMMMSENTHTRMMSVNAHSMMIRVFMRHMTPSRSANLRTSLQISLNSGSKGCASALWIHTRTCESCVGKYYTSNFSKTRGDPYDVKDRSLNHVCICLHLHGPLPPIVGPLTE